MSPPVDGSDEAGAEDRLRSLFSHHPHGVFGLDRSGRVLEVNPAAMAISGYTESELLGMGLEDLVDPRDLERAAQAFQRVLDRRPQELELTIRSSDGRAVEVAVTAIPWVDGDDVRGAYGIVDDVTQRNQTVRDLEATRRVAVNANEAKSDFVARMSHEIRTPLTSILTTIDLLAGADDDERDELLELLRRSGQRLLRLVDGVLDFGASGTVDAQVEEFDLHSVVRDAVALAARDADPKGVGVRLVLDDDVPQRIRDHPTWTVQILTNLLRNAVEHTDAGHVELAVRTVHSPTSGRLLTYRVEDTGAGIDDDLHPRVFDPFTTGPGARPVAGDGRRRTGLGLSIVKQLVTVSGGSIALDSAPGEGTTVTVVMPFRSVAVEPGPTG